MISTRSARSLVPTILLLLVLVGVAACRPHDGPSPASASSTSTTPSSSRASEASPRRTAAPRKQAGETGAASDDPSRRDRPAASKSPEKHPAVGETETRFWKDRSDLIRSPEPRPASPLVTTGLERVRLPNGLQVLTLPDPTLPVIDVQLVVLAGSIDEPKEEVGLAEFAVSMLRHGTKHMTADVLSSRIDSAGAYLHTSSDYETSSLSCGGRSRVLDLCLEVLSEIALHPTFPEDEMSEIRDRLLGSVKQTRDDPAALAELHFLNMLYGDDRPAGRPLTVQSIGRIARPDLASFHEKRFLPKSALLGISGKLDRRTALAKVKRYFGLWSGGAAAKRAIKPVEQPPPGLRLLLVDKPDLSQSYFALGHAGIRRTDPAKEAVSVMNYTLGGGGFSSRLMKVVRSERGKTYGISSEFDLAAIDGIFRVSSFTRNAELLSTIRLAKQEMARLSSDAPPTEDEMRAAKGKIAGGSVIRYQTTARLLGSLLYSEIFGLPDTEVTEYPVRIEKLSREAVAKSAKEHLHPDRLVAAVVGRAKEVAEQLRAAKIPFEGPIGYLDPISAEERAAKKKGR